MPAKYDQGPTNECGPFTLAEVLDDLGWRDTANQQAWTDEIHFLVHGDHNPRDLTSLTELSQAVSKFNAHHNKHIQNTLLFTFQDVLSYASTGKQVIIELREDVLEAGMHFGHIMRIIRVHNNSFDIIDSYGREDGSNRHQNPDGSVTYSIDQINKAIQLRPQGEPYGLAVWNQGGEQPMAGVPQSWSDDGKTLQGTNGIAIVLGFRQFVLDHDWNPENQAAEAEHEAINIPGDPNFPNHGTEQQFLFGGLQYTPERGVEGYRSGEALVNTRKQLEEAQALIAQLQQNQTGTDPIAQEAKQVVQSIKDILGKV